MSERVNARSSNGCGGYFAKVAEGFKARWVNPVHNSKGELEDLVTETEYKPGEVIRCNDWKPEGLVGTCDGHPTMFLNWDELAHCEYLGKEVA